MLGKAAVAIWCDVAYGVRPEFDDWHAHEHMPERLAIPGFLRGSRWVAERGALSEKTKLSGVSLAHLRKLARVWVR